MVFDDISENISSLVQNGKYGLVNTTDPAMPGYYVVKFISEPYMLQLHKIVNKQVMNYGYIIVNAVYLIMIKSNTDWYWEEHVNKYSVIISTSNIVHQCLNVATIKEVADIPCSLCYKK